MTGQATSKSSTETREIKLAHSPDSDDAFMFYALATHKLTTPGYKYTHVLNDIQTLNEAALTETYDVTALSFAAYPGLRDKYILLDCGASFGENYGPIVVAGRAMKGSELAGRRIAVPGLKTTAYLTLKLYEPNFEAVVTPFDKILEAVKNEVVDSGLLIHEGQLLFPQMGLHRVIDLGVWWHEQTGMPLPLGGNAVRRALGPEIGRAPGALWLRSDVERKAMFGVEETDRLPASAYASDVTRDIYRRLIDKARIALRAGQAALIDATFATAGERGAAASVAAEGGVPFTGLFLEAPLATRLERVGSRRADASDADVDVARRQTADPLREKGWAALAASGSLSDTTALARARLRAA